MRRVFVPVLVVFFLLPFSVSAETYYVDASRPDDSGDGLSEATAWKTIGKVNTESPSFVAGDIIKFKSGGVWRERLNTLSSGAPGNPVVFTYYGSGDKPIIMGSDSIMSGWVLYSGNTWYNDIPSTRPYAVYLDGESYKKGADRDSVDSTNRWYWDSSALRLYIYAISDPSSFYSSIEVPQRSMALRVSSRNYHKYDGLHFKYGYNWAIGFSGTSSYIELVNCTVEGAGQGSSVEFADSVNNIIIDNCRIDGGNKARYNDAIRAIGSGISNCVIKNSEISRGAHAGLLLGYTSNWLVENNEFWSEEGFGRNIDIHGNLGEGFHTIRYNYFHDAHWGNGICQGPDQFAGEGVELSYNIFENAEYRGFHLWGVSSGFPVKDYKIYNNVVYGAGDYGIRISTATSGNEFKNNIIFNNDPSTHYQVLFTSGSLISAVTFENNTIYDYSTSTPVYDGSSARTVAWMDNNYPEWNNNIAIDPELFDAQNGDFSLQSDSPCIDAGTNVGLTLDFEGNSVPYGAYPDMGAYEYGSQPSNCTGTCKPNPCDSYYNCTDGSGTCVTGYCCSGDCSLCNNTICEQGENCSSCPEDCNCSPQLCCDGVCSLPACFNETDCGSDPCKDYTCSNPGTCQASCSSQNKTSCEGGDGCCPPGCNEGDDYDCTIPGPVALYHFDEDEGNISGDSSGNGNDGTVYGANWTNDSVSGYALEFDGVDDYVDLGNPDSLDFGAEDFTITVWINNKVFGTEPGTESQYVIGRGWGDQGTQKGYALDFKWDSYWHDRLRFAIADGSNKVVCIKNVEGYFDNYKDKWLFLAVKRDGGTLYVYLNGTQWYSCDASGIGDISVSGGFNDIVYIGDSPYTVTNFYWNGTIDEVRIYDRALSEEEILNLYTNPGGEAIPGDLNNDGSVDIFDLGIIAANFGKTSGYDQEADVVPNSEIDVFDLVFVASRFT